MSGIASNSIRKRSRPPAFTPVKLRPRRDGWNAELQCAFLAELYLSGSVAAAARRLGRSRESAHRLRTKAGAESFASAWDHILAGPAPPGVGRKRRRKVRDWRKVTLEHLIWRSVIGLWRPLIYRGTMHGIAHKPDNSALLRVISRLDARATKLEDRSS